MNTNQTAHPTGQTVRVEEGFRHLCLFVSIRGYSCPFVVIRVHSWLFVSIRGYLL